MEDTRHLLDVPDFSVGTIGPLDDGPNVRHPCGSAGRIDMLPAPGRVAIMGRYTMSMKPSLLRGRSHFWFFQEGAES